MRGLITIYVSVILVFSPLFGQSKQDGRLIQQRKSEWSDYWNIRLIRGELFSHVALLGLKGDSLVISDMEISRTIYIGSIHRFNSITGKSDEKAGALIGFISGFLLGLKVVTDLNCGGKGTCNKDTEERAALWGLLFGGVFGWIGAAIGGRFKHDRVYDMSDWSIDEKKVLIQEILKK